MLELRNASRLQSTYYSPLKELAVGLLGYPSAKSVYVNAQGGFLQISSVLIEARKASLASRTVVVKAAGVHR